MASIFSCYNSLIQNGFFQESTEQLVDTLSKEKNTPTEDLLIGALKWWNSGFLYKASEVLEEIIFKNQKEIIYLKLQFELNNMIGNVTDFLKTCKYAEFYSTSSDFYNLFFSLHGFGLQENRYHE